MSDAFTDIRVDNVRMEVLHEQILPLELKLLSEQATREDIETLLTLWKAWAQMRPGYWTVTNRQLFEQRKQLYEKLLRDGEVVIRLADGR